MCIFAPWVQMPLELRVARSLDLKLQVIVSALTWVLRFGFRVSERTLCVLKCCALSPTNLLRFIPNRLSHVSLCEHSFSFIDQEEWTFFLFYWPGIVIFCWFFMIYKYIHLCVCLYMWNSENNLRYLFPPPPCWDRLSPPPPCWGRLSFAAALLNYIL